MFIAELYEVLRKENAKMNVCCESKEDNPERK